VEDGKMRDIKYELLYTNSGNVPARQPGNPKKVEAFPEQMREQVSQLKKSSTSKMKKQQHENDA
jgi:hypothetical protein